MLSILIPVYNFDITALVASLREQLIVLDIVYEICCLDDASTNKAILQKNLEINDFMHCTYTVQPENLGRSTTRNNLLERSRYDFLIFLDCDVIPARPNFIQNYVAKLKEDQVVYGGLEYAKNSPHTHTLHYRYGSKREVIAYQQRAGQTPSNFSSANFGLHKSKLPKVTFDEQIKTYGFEDLVFAKTLIANKVSISQLDNPVIHLGIEQDNLKFLQKEQESLHTLKFLAQNNLLSDNDVQLLAFNSRLRSFGLAGIYRFFYRFVRPVFEKQLIAKKPSLFIFDLYRLGYYMTIED